MNGIFGVVMLVGGIVLFLNAKKLFDKPPNKKDNGKEDFDGSSFSDE